MIDAHAHLTHDVELPLALLERAKDAGVVGIINVCTGTDDLMRGLSLAKTCHAPKIYTVAAQTPHDALHEDEEFFRAVEEHAQSLVAIGEIGLDYHYDFAPKDKQKALFVRYLKLASTLKLPVVIHCREAFYDLADIIDATAPELKVMLHCFTGTLEEAKEAVRRGWYVSMSGIVTFPKSTSLQDVARFVPDDNLLIETDSPYLAPQGHRGKTNEPAFLGATAKFVANLRGVPVESLVEITTRNVKRLFHGVS
ncbi:MAG: TatD family hydrolase [Verrucomicrobia bacterium]|nr:TatD family hydrolase [Verrucomicrobiota bacterium]MBS0636044.1 TatD family hydrolase [Verrucomicrobiota bacterium]